MGMMDCLIDDASGPVRGGWRGAGGEDFESVPLVRTHEATSSQSLSAW